MSILSVLASNTIAKTIAPKSALVFGLHGFNDYQEGLSFLGLLVANAIGFCSMFFWRNRFLAAADPKTGMPPPEARLQPAMAGAILSPVGLFIFAFTAYENVHWIGPIIGSTIYGIGVLYVFFSVFRCVVISHEWPHRLRSSSWLT